VIIAVEPGALEQSAASCDRAAETAAGVLACLRSEGAPDTGRGDSRAAVASLLDRVDRALLGWGTALTADADALRGSASRYVRTDACAVPQDRA
jgi:uncharacterized protein YukE